VSLGEISVPPDKPDQNGLNDFISEISTSISGVNAALGDIIRRIDRLEQTNSIPKIPVNNEILPKNKSNQNEQKQSDRIPRHPKITTTADPPPTDNPNRKSPDKNMKPDNPEDKSIMSNLKQSKKRKLQNEKSIEDNIDPVVDERHSNIAENLGNRSGQVPSNYPGEEKYLVDCLSSLSGELTKNLNFLLKYSKLYPEQFLLPIYLTNCENLNDLNFNLNFINSNILILLTELSCNSPTENDKLFREIHLLSIMDRKSFLKKLNMIIAKLLEYLIKIFTIFQNIEIINFEFKLFKQFNKYSNISKEFISNKNLHNKFYETDFIIFLDNLTRDFIYVNFKIKNKISKISKHVLIDYNINKVNKLNLPYQIKTKTVKSDFYLKKDFKKLNSSNNDFKINLQNKFRSKEFTLKIKQFFSVNCNDYLNTIIKNSFPKLINNFDFKIKLEQFNEIFLFESHDILCHKSIEFLFGKLSKLSTATFNEVEFF